MYKNTLIWVAVPLKNSVDPIQIDFRGARRKKGKTGRAGKSYKMISLARQFPNGSDSGLLMLHPQGMHQCERMPQNPQTVKDYTFVCAQLKSSSEQKGILESGISYSYAVHERSREQRRFGAL